MKKSIIFRFLALAALIVPTVFAACSDDDKEGAFKEIYVNSKTSDEVLINGMGNSVTVTVTSNEEWNINGKPEWITTTVAQKDANGNQVVTIDAEKNTEEKRTAVMEFVAINGSKATLTVVQDVVDENFRSLKEIKALYTGEDYTFSGDLWTNASVISNFRSKENGGLENDPSLRTLVISDGIAGLTVSLAVENTTLALGDQVTMNLRDLMLTVNDGGVMQLVGKSGGVPNSTLVKAGTRVIKAKEVTMDEARDPENESMYVAVSPVQVMDEDKDATFVRDDNHTAIRMEAETGEKFVLFSAAASSFKEEKVPAGSGVLKGIATMYDGVCNIAITSEDDYAQMTGERFISRDEPKVFKVTPIVTIVDSEAGSTEVEVIADDDVAWIVESSNGEFDMSQNSGTGPATITISYEANTEYMQERRCVFTFRTEDAGVPEGYRMRVAAVTQSAPKWFNVRGNDVINITADASGATIAVDGDVEWKAVSSHPDFVVDPVTGLAPSVCTVYYSANHNNTIRTVTVTISTDDVAIPADKRSKTITFIQAASGSFTVTPSEITVGSPAGTMVVETYGSDWTVSSSDKANFTPEYDYYDSRGKVLVTVSYTANTDPNNGRTATLTFVARSSSVPENERIKTVTITQEKHSDTKFMNITSTAIPVGMQFGTSSVWVSSNVAWTATCNNPDFAISPTSGTGSFSINAKYNSNMSTTEDKVAVITVTTTDESIPVEDRVQTTTITQAKVANGGAATYTLVTSDSQITSGTYIIAGHGDGKIWTFGEAVNNNVTDAYVPGVMSSFAAGSATINDTAGDLLPSQVILVDNGGIYEIRLIKNGYYLTSCTSNYNSLANQERPLYTLWDLSVSNTTTGEMEIVHAGASYKRKYMRFGADHRFTNYGEDNTEPKVYLYKMN